MQIPKYFYYRVKTDRKGLTVEIEDASDVDVAEVVRCRECLLQRVCKPAQYLGDDGFCSNGERKGGDE